MKGNVMENNELENESVNNVGGADQHEVLEDTTNQVEETTQPEDTTENVVEDLCTGQYMPDM